MTDPDKKEIPVHVQIRFAVYDSLIDMGCDDREAEQVINEIEGPR